MMVSPRCTSRDVDRRLLFSSSMRHHFYALMLSMISTASCASGEVGEPKPEPEPDPGQTSDPNQPGPPSLPSATSQSTTANGNPSDPITPPGPLHSTHEMPHAGPKPPAM
jgi:hypothetical protein